MVYSRSQIAAEYDRAAGATAEHDKVKWGSDAKMNNRFRLVRQKCDFNHCRRWLDVGCGTGGLQALILKEHSELQAVGIDLSSELVSYARQRPELAGVDFRIDDFMDYNTAPFDLVTAIGVLQKTTCTLADFFKHAFELTTPNGTLFIDTKCRNWKRFREPGFLPGAEHDWFSADELKLAAQSAGYAVVELSGFEPATGGIVAIEESHTIFMIARRGSER